MNEPDRWPLARRCALLAVITCAALLLTGGATNARAGAASGAGSGNRKIGVASALYLNSDPAKLTAAGAYWAYAWDTKVPANHTVRWVPMVWGSAYVTPKVIASLVKDKRRGRARYLLGFDEPDSKSQANMTPKQAADLWPQLESTGLILGSPAPAVPTDGWLAKFMKLAQQRHLRVNFIALHYYQDFTNPDAVAQLRRQLVRIHDQFHRPIWVTEIGALNIRSWGEPMLRAASSSRAVSYMHKLFAMLNALPFVQRYAWFTDNCSNDVACRDSSLFNGKGQLTPAGHAFQSAAG